MSNQRVLISGAGIAGPVCAFFLNKAGIHTTIIERAPALRKAGQQIDIRGPGVEVIKRMGVETAIRAKTTKEAGLAFVDSKGKIHGEFPVDAEGGSSFTSDIEIIRADLVDIFYDATKDHTEYVFGDYIAKVHDNRNVELSGGEKRSFDVIVGADGMSSKVRRLAFPEIENPIRSLNQIMTFFTIPYKESDGTFAKWYNAPGGRNFLLRPDAAGCTRAYASIMGSDLGDYLGRDTKDQKQRIRELFTDAGWESLRVLDGMDNADDFYMQEIGQVKMSAWCKDRVALIGDAAYCPSPISGYGTTLAIIGAYILAGEIAACNKDWQAAFANYEKKMRPYVDKAQNIPAGFPGLLSPQTAWGIWLLHCVTAFVAWTRLPQLLAKFSGKPSEDKTLPNYTFGHSQDSSLEDEA